MRAILPLNNLSIIDGCVASKSVQDSSSERATVESIPCAASYGLVELTGVSSSYRFDIMYVKNSWQSC